MMAFLTHKDRDAASISNAGQHTHTYTELLKAT